MAAWSPTQLLLLALAVFGASAHDVGTAKYMRHLRQVRDAGRAAKTSGPSHSILAPPEEAGSKTNGHLKLVSGKLKAHLDAWLSDVLSDKFDKDPKKCANETAAMMDELRYAYTRRLVPEVLRDECKHFLYYERFGSDEEVCYAIVEHLVNTWKGDQDYETWCKEAYAKRHTAKDASEIPKKPDPGPRKGKYADVEEFSYPNDADPEKHCHGAPNCGSKSKKRSGLATDESPSPKRGRTEGVKSSTTALSLGSTVLAPLLLILAQLA